MTVTSYTKAWIDANLSTGGTLAILDVRDYGAVFDNSTDDTAAIQAALNAAVVAVTGLSGNDLAGAIVQMPPGRAHVTQLQMPSNVWLRGAGPSGTYLVKTSTTNDCIVLKTGNEFQCTLSDFGIIQSGTATAGAGIHFNQAGGAGILGDPRHRIFDVIIVETYYGIQLDGGTEIRIDRCTIQRARNVGIAATQTDMFISNTTVAASASHGFDIFGGNTRLWGCKAFGGGNGSPDTFGFHIGGSGRHEVTACEAQDVNGSGFSVDGQDSSVWSSVVADSCSGYGFHFATVNSGRVQGAVIARSGGLYTPSAGVDIPAYAVSGNSIQVSIGGGGSAFNYLSNAPGHGSTIVINNMLATQSVTYAATITPDPYAGGTIYVGTLTGNITINNPSTTHGANWPMGMRMAFVLTQDATAGRTTTFGANYTLVGGALGSTGAGTTRRIEFEWNGTTWREVTRN